MLELRVPMQQLLEVSEVHLCGRQLRLRHLERAMLILVADPDKSTSLRIGVRLTNYELDIPFAGLADLLYHGLL